MPNGPQQVASPCIGVCELGEDEVCLGCGRTLDDIAIWSGADDAQRLRIIEQAQQRLGARDQDQSPQVFIGSKNS